MTTWITALDAPGSGLRVAVKDAIDVAAVPTTAGCAALADAAVPAGRDAACLAGARAAGARLVGKANLHELCYGTSGANPWFGTPVNPLDPGLVPGGSSSGSAVAVATGEADVGLGTDTGGSVRLPAACCGIAGLKTTWGRVPLEGVWPLAPSLDTVGPLGRDVDAVVAGMALLEPGFAPAPSAPAVIGRVRMPGVDPAVDAAVDRALQLAEVEVVDVEMRGWDAAMAAFSAVIRAEAWASDRELVERSPERVGEQVRARLLLSAATTAAEVDAARSTERAWRAEVAAAFERVEVLALPTLVGAPPALGADNVPNNLVSPWNFAGVPALSLPVPARWPGPVPASLQLVAPWGREEALCALGRVVEAAVR